MTIATSATRQAAQIDNAFFLSFSLSLIHDTLEISLTKPLQLAYDKTRNEFCFLNHSL
jgi:hypothetical protein